MRSEPMLEFSDEVLMDRYARGDGSAFDALFARYHERIYGYFLRRTGSDDRAADLYQDLFLRLHRARESFDPTREFAPWFFQIARRLLIDAFRHEGRSLEDLALEDSTAARSASPDPESRALAAEQANAVLAQLRELERHVLVSAKVYGRDYAEIASELGKSIVAIKKLASRAIQRLRADQEKTATVR